MCNVIRVAVFAAAFPSIIASVDSWQRIEPGPLFSGVHLCHKLTVNILEALITLIFVDYCLYLYFILDAICNSFSYSNYTTYLL